RKESIAKNMSNPHEQAHSSLLQVLEAPERSNELTDREDIYGWLIGGWEGTGFDYAAGGTGQRRRGGGEFGLGVGRGDLQDGCWRDAPSRMSGSRHLDHNGATKPYQSSITGTGHP